MNALVNLVMFISLLLKFQAVFSDIIMPINTHDHFAKKLKCVLFQVLAPIILDAMDMVYNFEKKILHGNF